MTKKIKDRAAFGQALKARRIEQELSLRMVADKLNVPHQRIIEVESGEMAGIDYYLDYARVLDSELQLEWKKPG